MRRGGYLPSDFPTIESLVDEANRKLFKSTSLLKIILMSCDTYLLLSPPQRDPYEQGLITSSCPLKTIETLCQGLFMTVYAPHRVEPWSWKNTVIVLVLF